MSHVLSTEPPHTPPPSFIEERGKRIKLAAEIGLARSSHSRLWARALRRRLHRQRKLPQHPPACIGSRKPRPFEQKEVPLVADVTEGKKEEIVERVRVLQRLVPGGEEMDVERLFEETADYIEALKEQVGVMRALACLLDGVERESGAN